MGKRLEVFRERGKMMKCGAAGAGRARQLLRSVNPGAQGTTGYSAIASLHIYVPALEVQTRNRDEGALSFHTFSHKLNFYIIQKIIFENQSFYGV